MKPNEDGQPLISQSSFDKNNATTDQIINKQSPVENSIMSKREKKSQLQILHVAGRILNYLISLILKSFVLMSRFLLVIFLVYWLYGGVPSLLLFIAAVLGWCYNFQDRLLYQPDQPPMSRIFVNPVHVIGFPAQLQENLFIRTRDGVKINLLFLKQPPEFISHATTLLLFHGNAGNVGDRLHLSYDLYRQSKVNILLVEYRGYGKSEGSPSEEGLLQDAIAALKYITQRTDINQSRIAVYGRSLGGAVAISLSSRSECASNISCLILENTFTSVPDIGSHIFSIPFINWFPHFIFKNKFLSKKRITGIKIPTLFISGLADNLIPPKMMAYLYEKSGSKLKRCAQFPDGSHNETWQCEGFFNSINCFLEEVNNHSNTSGVSPAEIYRTPISPPHRLPFV